MAEIKVRYSDQDLEEFRQVIDKKLAVARQEYKEMMSQLDNADSNDVADTSPTYKALEDGTINQSKEEIIDIAVTGARLCKSYRENAVGNYRFEYSPESFTGTEPEFALEICNVVIKI